MKERLIFLLLPLLMSGCGIYNKYERPNDIPVPLSYRDIPLSERSSDNLAVLSWRTLFTDTCLQNLIDKGLEYNTELSIARLRVEQAEAVLLSSKLAYLPSLSADAEGGLNSIDGAKPGKSYTIAGKASWEIDIFGKVTNAKREARAELEKTRAYELAVQTQLIATVADSYYMLLTLDRQLEINRATLEAWEKTVRTMEVLKHTGQQNDTDVLQAQANCLALRASLSQTEQSIHETENSLSVLLGVTPQHIHRGTIADVQLPPALHAGVPLQLLENRPDIRQAEAELAKAFYATNSARAAFYPSLILSGTAGWTNNTGGSIINPAQILLSAVSSLTQPLFNKGENIANLRVTKADMEIARKDFQQALLNAGQEVNDALTQYQMADKRTIYYKDQIDALRKVVHKTELLMKHSSVNYLEVLTAHRSLLTAELSQVQNRFEQIQGMINLYHALGGGIL